VSKWPPPPEPCCYEPPEQREDHAERDASDHDGHRCGLVRRLAGDLEERKGRQREDEVPDNDGDDGSGHVAVPEVSWCLTKQANRRPAGGRSPARGTSALSDGLGRWLCMARRLERMIDLVKKSAYVDGTVSANLNQRTYPQRTKGLVLIELYQQLGT